MLVNILYWLSHCSFACEDLNLPGDMFWLMMDGKIPGKLISYSVEG